MVPYSSGSGTLGTGGPYDDPGVRLTDLSLRILPNLVGPELALTHACVEHKSTVEHVLRFAVEPVFSNAWAQRLIALPLETFSPTNQHVEVSSEGSLRWDYRTAILEKRSYKYLNDISCFGGVRWGYGLTSNKPGSQYTLRFHIFYQV